jgi:hypothetical protein
MRLLAWDHVARLDELIVHFQRRQERTSDTQREARPFGSQPGTAPGKGRKGQPVP